MAGGVADFLFTDCDIAPQNHQPTGVLTAHIIDYVHQPPTVQLIHENNIIPHDQVV